MTPITITVQLPGTDTDGIMAAQSLGAAGSFDLNGAIAVDGVADIAPTGGERQVRLSPAADESARTFTVEGTNASGAFVLDTVAGANAVPMLTTVYFASVSRISVDGATSGTVSAGTTAVGSSGWIPLDFYRNPIDVGFAITVDGTVNYTVQHTYQPLLGSGFDFVPRNFDHATLAAETTTQTGTYKESITGMRVHINSGTGTLTIDVLQAGLSGR